MVDEEVRNCSNHGGGAGQTENPKIFVKNNNVGPGVGGPGNQEQKHRGSSQGHFNRLGQGF